MNIYFNTRIYIEANKPILAADHVYVKYLKTLTSYLVINEHHFQDFQEVKEGDDGDYKLWISDENTSRYMKGDIVALAYIPKGGWKSDPPGFKEELEKHRRLEKPFMTAIPDIVAANLKANGFVPIEEVENNKVDEFFLEDIEDVRIIIKVKGKNYGIIANEQNATKEEAKEFRIMLLRALLEMQTHVIVVPALEDIGAEKRRTKFEVGNRVTRGKNHLYSSPSLKGINGTIVDIIKFPGICRCKIKWDVKASNGQWHSTINAKFLMRV